MENGFEEIKGRPLSRYCNSCGVYLPSSFDYCPACGRPVLIDAGANKFIDASNLIDRIEKLECKKENPKENVSLDLRLLANGGDETKIKCFDGKSISGYARNLEIQTKYEFRDETYRGIEGQIIHVRDNPIRKMHIEFDFTEIPEKEHE